MKPYLAYLQARFGLMLQYRAAALAGMSTQFFWGFVKLMIFEAFFNSTAAPVPMEFHQVVAYIWLGQAFLGLLPWNLDRDIQEMIKTGSVAYELLRPLDLYGVWYTRTLAWRTGATLLRSIPLLLVSGILLPLIGAEKWSLSLPPNFIYGGLFALSMIMVILLSSAITTLAHGSLMWTISGGGVSPILGAMVTIFSGMVIPLPLFPDWIQPLFSLLPFRALVDVPFRIYSGSIPLAEVSRELLLQAAWIVVLVAAGRRVIGRGIKKLVIQGG